MTEVRDPFLEALMMQSETDLAEREFTNRVMSMVEVRRRNVLIGRLAILALLVFFEIILSSPLQHSLGVIGQILDTSLVDLENEWAIMFLSPLNSVAGLIGVMLLGMHYLYRKMVR
jgi:hypothetical protein